MIATPRSAASPAWLLGIVLLGVPSLSSAAEELTERWGPLRLLEGSWRGTVVGELGEGEAVRQYQFLFADTYLVTRHSSVRLPQDKSPDGDHHRELTVFSRDRVRGVVVLREFNVEGFVLEYGCVLEHMRVVCTSTRIESGPGMRARVTLEIENAYRFEERFELAQAEGELQHYLSVHWQRAPGIDDH